MGTYSFGKNSEKILANARQYLQRVARLALSWGIMDFSVVETHRNKATQNGYFARGKSRVQWPDGKHNSLPSDAFDLVPFINGKGSYNKAHCLVLAGLMLAAAAVLGVRLRWGGNWDMDGEPITDQDFQDLVHYEVV